MPHFDFIFFCGNKNEYTNPENKKVSDIIGNSYE
jgi:hypothetical protein